MIGFLNINICPTRKTTFATCWHSPRQMEHMHEKEERLLYKIGKRYGLKDRQVKTLVDSEEDYELNIPDNHNDRMDLLYDLVLMVYADERVDASEIAFCEDVVKRFGLKRDLLKWLLSEFDRGTPPPPEEWEEIKRTAQAKFSLKK
ncbi:MAG: hypothetical protein HC859_03430 [Bacteroidia bacterium]|nr:hypothetical protein [Bacteroidia bacterium]